MFTWQVVEVPTEQIGRMSVQRWVPIWFDGRWEIFPLHYVRLVRLLRAGH